MTSTKEVIYPTPGYSFCFQMTRDRKLHYNWHHHIEYELMVFRKGSGEVQIADIIHSFRNPAAFLITPKTDHAFISQGQFEGWILQISPEILEHYRCQPEFNFLRELLGRSSPAVGFSPQTSKKIIDILEKAQVEEGIFRWLCLIEAFYIAAQDEQSRPFTFKTVSPHTPENKEVEEVVNYIYERFTESHRIEDLAKAAGMPSQSFCRHFKKRTGMTVVEYLHSIRINNAKKLLQQSKFYVDDICYEVGFNSISFFNRKFKEHTGMTPVEYRRLFRKSINS